MFYSIQHRHLHITSRDNFALIDFPHLYCIYFPFSTMKNLKLNPFPSFPIVRESGPNDTIYVLIIQNISSIVSMTPREIED